MKNGDLGFQRAFWISNSLRFVLPPLLIAISGHALAVDCNAILRGGVFDTDEHVSNSYKYQIIRKASCSGSASGNLISLDASVSNVCSSDFSSLLNRETKLDTLRRASKVIADAWTSCIAMKGTGLVHYLSPTSDPETFHYTILYNNKGKPYSTQLKKWEMSPSEVMATCFVRDKQNQNQNQKQIKNELVGQAIDNGGKTFTCHRKRDQAVTVIAEGDIGGAAPFIELPKNPTEWHLIMGPADDYAECKLSGKNGVIPYIRGINDVKGVWQLDDHLKDTGTEFTCHAIDKAPFHGHSCFSYEIIVLKDGDAFVDHTRKCCDPTCGVAPVAGSAGVYSLYPVSVSIPGKDPPKATMPVQ
jgi:hypothetical protein